jgi:hypothetical protein
MKLSLSKEFRSGERVAIRGSEITGTIIQPGINPIIIVDADREHMKVRGSDLILIDPMGAITRRNRSMIRRVADKVKWFVNQF